MKRQTIILAVAAVAAAVSCSPKADSTYVLKGTVTSSAPLEGVVMVTTGEKTDTVAIDENGAFTYTGSADITKMTTIAFQNPGKRSRSRSHYARFISEPGKTLTVALTDTVSTVTGSALTDTLNAYSEKIGETYMAYNDALMKAYKENNDAEYDKVSAQRDSAIKALIIPAYKQNAENAVGGYLLSQVVYDLPIEELEEYYNLGGQAMKDNKQITRILNLKKAEVKTSEGCMFADFDAKTFDGQDCKLSDYVGKGDYVFIDFWASWCGPCMAAVPELAALHKTYGPKGLKVIGVNVWEREEGAGAKCVEEKNMTWTVLVEETGAATDLYGVVGIPTALIFAPDGTIVKRGHPLSMDAANFFKEIYK